MDIKSFYFFILLNQQDKSKTPTRRKLSLGEAMRGPTNRQTKSLIEALCSRLKMGVVWQHKYIIVLKVKHENWSLQTKSQLFLDNSRVNCYT
jgi:hypothetical protein